MEEEIKAEFERSGFSIDDEEEVLKKCLTFCINYKLSSSDLVSSWEVFYLNRQFSGSSVQNAHMDGFLLHLQNEQKDAVTKGDPHLHIYSSNDVDMILNDEHEDTKEGILGTPVDRSEITHSDLSDFTPGINGKSTSGKQLKLVSNHITPFGQRKTKFVVQLSFNKSPGIENGIKEENFESLEDDVIRRVKPSEKCSLQIRVSQPEPGCRFMYDRIEDRFNALEDRIRKYANALVASGLYEEPMDPTVASQKTVFSVGMVCCDGEGRLNEKSILLQGRILARGMEDKKKLFLITDPAKSVEHSGGQRVRLDIQKLTQFSFFPGQVVGVEGHNPSGHCLVASNVVDAIPLFVPPDMGLPPTKKQALDEEFQPTPPSSMLGELSLVIAAGPFTTTDNLLFEPLVELLAYASRKQPQLLMLLGPFVDSEHPEIKKGTVDRSFAEIFHVEILRRLQDYAEFMGSAARVILVPSIRDANHDFVFPQPAFDIRSDLKNQISSFSNPGLFYANEVKVGCCTVDILRQLSGEEISRNPANGSSGDRMSRLAIRLLSQRSFYPLYPPSEGVPLDLSLAPEAMQISSIPDIIVLPSDLTPFVKVLSIGGRMDGEEQSKCVCVNPGRLAKGIGGGTFIDLNYQGNLDRTSASIIRI